MLTAGAAVVACVQWILVTRCPFWPPLAVLVVAAFAWVSRLLISRGIRSLSTRQRMGEGLGAWCLFEVVVISWVCLLALVWESRHLVVVGWGSLSLLQVWLIWVSQPQRKIRWANAHPWQRRVVGVFYLGLLAAPIGMALPRLLPLWGITSLSWPLVAVLAAPIAWLAWGPVLAWYSLIESPIQSPAFEEIRNVAVGEVIGNHRTLPAELPQKR